MILLLAQHKKLTGCFIALLLFSLVSGLYSWRLCQLSIEQYHAERSEFRQFAVSLHQSSDEKEFLAENLGVFQAQLQSGVLGEVAPQIWVEAFEKLRVALELDGLFYEISPAITLETTQNSSIHAQLSAIKFQVSLKHDEALFQFFYQLGNSVSAPYRITRLEIFRGDGREGEITQSSLQAIGEIAWVTVVPLPDESVGV